MTKKKSARQKSTKSTLMIDIARRVGEAAGTVVNATQALAGQASSTIAARKKKAAAPARPTRKKPSLSKKKRIQKKSVPLKSKKRASR